MTAMAVDILTEGHDVSSIAKSPIHQTSGVPDGGGVASVYYEGDLSDSDCGSVEDRERDTWDDWCDSAFCNGYGGFTPDPDDTHPPVVFSDNLFWDDDIAEPSRMLPDGGYAPVLTSPILAGTIMPLMLLDTDQTVRLDNSGLELLDSRIGEFSVLSLDTGGGGHQAEIYVGSAGRIAPTTASGCGYSGSGPSSGSGSSGVGEFVTASVGGNADSTGGRGFTARISSKVRPHGGGAAWIAVPRDAMDVEMRSSSVSYVVQPQLVPSRISVVLVEETEVRGAECLASGPVDKVVRWSAGETCPSGLYGWCYDARCCWDAVPVYL